MLIWDAQTGSQPQALEGYTSIADTVAFSPDGKTLASIQRWHFAAMGCSKRNTPTVTGGHGAIYSVAFTPDGKTLASDHSEDGTVSLWDVQNGSLLRVLEGYTGAIYSVAFSPGGKMLASGNFDGTVLIWDAQTGSQLQVLEGHTSVVNTVDFSSDGKTLASGGADGTVRLWGIP